MRSPRSLAAAALLVAVVLALVLRLHSPLDDDVEASAPGAAAAGGGAEVVLATLSDERTGRELADDASLEGSIEAAAMGTVDITVRRRGNGAGVPAAPVYVHGDEFEWFETDERGKVSVPVPAGKVDLGTNSLRGRGLLALPYDAETGEPSSEKRVEVRPGETVAVDLELHLAGSITGHVLRPDGSPAALLTFVRMHAEGERWSRPFPIRTDANGRFHMPGLEPNWYLLGPDPQGADVFAFEKLQVSLGEAADVEIRLAPGRLGTVRVEVVQETSGDPYPFPVFTTIVRADGLADTSAHREPSWKRRGWSRRSPIELDHELRPASYRVDVEMRRGWSDDDDRGVVIAPYWKRGVVFEVGEDLEDPVAQVDVPRLGPIADVRGRLTRPFAGKGRRLSARYRDARGSSRETQLSGYAARGDFRLFVDLDFVPDGRVLFVESFDGEATLLHEAVLVEGRHRIELTPTE